MLSAPPGLWSQGWSQNPLRKGTVNNRTNVSEWPGKRNVRKSWIVAQMWPKMQRFYGVLWTSELVLISGWGSAFYTWIKWNQLQRSRDRNSQFLRLEYQGVLTKCLGYLSNKSSIYQMTRRDIWKSQMRLDRYESSAFDYIFKEKNNKTSQNR